MKSAPKVEDIDWSVYSKQELAQIESAAYSENQKRVCNSFIVGVGGCTLDSSHWPATNHEATVSASGATTAQEEKAVISWRTAR